MGQCRRIQAGASGRDRGRRRGGLVGCRLSPHNSGNLAAREGPCNTLQWKLHRALGSAAPVLRRPVLDFRTRLLSLWSARRGNMVLLPTDHQTPQQLEGVSPGPKGCAKKGTRSGSFFISCGKGSYRIAIFHQRPRRGCAAEHVAPVNHEARLVSSTSIRHPGSVSSRWRGDQNRGYRERIEKRIGDHPCPVQIKTGIPSGCRS